MNYDEYNTIGSDEAGVGDYFGPMTVCAAYVPKDKIALLKELGVKDSKNLSNNTVIKIAGDLIHTVTYSLVVLDNPSYNKKIDEGWNIVKLKAVLHDHCIRNVHDKLDEDERGNIEKIVIDQFTTLNAYNKYVPDPFMIEKIHQETKAESKSLAVAAASIIARAKYLEQMANLDKTLKDKVPRGASKQVDAFAARLAKKHGMDYVDSLTKKHFKTREKVQALLK
ncbi:ribonuclease HIII [Salinicoccus halitifaciens]|uniref:Ribonuclease n=1 Tax=Salinicoccus halitifaciens TaxID=1073415 RepID=A0ABV2E610_9STAP|nr:ribonuclease HIII [Salinicoccus halitifaciens]MCD2137093.1 ribonuclease HIII [Salinicoccus halitifaciens]